MIDEIPNCPIIANCHCYPGEEPRCVCGVTEKALRAWGTGRLTTPMSTAQTEWCLNEIDSVEGYDRRDYETAPDDVLAMAVLDAWRDYCRDKGLM